MENHRPIQLLAILLVCSVATGLGCTPPKPATPATTQQIEALKEDIQQLLRSSDTRSVDKYKTQFDAMLSKIKASDVIDPKVVEEYKSMRDSIPTLAGLELADSIASIDWLLEMNRLLSPPLTAEALSDAEALLAEVPSNLGDDIATKYAKRHSVKVIEYGESLAKQGTDEANSLSLTLEMLRRLKGASGDRVAELMNHLEAKEVSVRKAELVKALVNDVKDLTSQLEIANAITDIDLKHAALTSLSQSVEALRLQLAMQKQSEGLQATSEIKARVDKALTKSYSSLSERQNALLKKARMRYQAWALAEIEKAKTMMEKVSIDNELYRLRDEAGKSKDPVEFPWPEFKGVRELFEGSFGKLAADGKLSSEQQAKVGPFVKEQWYSIFYQVNHDIAVAHLLPIDQGLLEPSVAKFYTEAFEKVWSELEKDKVKALKLSLAKMTAQVPKQGLEDLSEEK